MLCSVTVLAGVVAEADADAWLGDALARALEANERLTGLAQELEAENARLRQAARERDELAAAQLAARDAQIAALAAQVEELRRRLDKDSSTSSKPPSSDSPYQTRIHE